MALTEQLARWFMPASWPGSITDSIFDATPTSHTTQLNALGRHIPFRIVEKSGTPSGYLPFLPQSVRRPSREAPQPISRTLVTFA